MHWYLEVLKKYAVLSGRACRKEFWLFLLFNVIIVYVLAVIDGAAGLPHTAGGWGLLSGLYALGVLLPSLAVAVRRLQDTDHSGGWLLLIALPVVGLIWFFILMIRAGQPGQNRFGPNPKEPVTNGTSATAAAKQVRTPDPPPFGLTAVKLKNVGIALSVYALEWAIFYYLVMAKIPYYRSESDDVMIITAFVAVPATVVTIYLFNRFVPNPKDSN